MTSSDPFSAPPSGDPISGDPASSATSTPKRRGRSALAIGLTAGLLGGAGAGMVFGVPGLTSASTSAVLTQVDEPADEVPADEVPADAERPERGERLREALQPLVDDGTISAEQADAIAQHLVENAPDRPGKGRVGAFGRGVVSEAVTDLLGLTPAEVREQLRAGSTLAEIATEQGVEPQAVIDELVAEAGERLDQAVANERITQEEADEKLADVTERVTDVVNNGRPERGDAEGFRGGPGRLRGPGAPVGGDLEG